jgi:hypothetical protein
MRQGGYSFGSIRQDKVAYGVKDAFFMADLSFDRS